MKIKSLELHDFRGIEKAHFDLNCKNSVFFGVNGVGKSTVLNAVIDLIYPMIKGNFELNKKKVPQIEDVDIQEGKASCEIQCELELGEEPFLFLLRKERGQKKRPAASGEYKKAADLFSKQYLGNDQNMPIFVNYGVNRTVIEVPLRIRNQHTFDKMAVFDNAMDSTVDFRTFFEWFRQQEDLENELKVRSNPAYKDPSLQAVKSAIQHILKDTDNLRIERNPLAMKLDKGNVSLRVEQLSDGEKCTLALLGDLARRMALANPTLENPLEGTGVVLIDEIELHMHPSWQSSILSALKECFPNIQFIITTHSPTVLGQLDDSYCIISLFQNEDRISFENIGSLIAWDTNYILKDFMDTDNLSEKGQSLINSIYESLQKQVVENAQLLVNKLSGLTSPSHEDVIKAELLLRRLKRRKGQMEA